jgi:hypothetical protein
MIENKVKEALREIYPDSTTTCEGRITAFQTIVQTNFRPLQTLGRQLADMIGLTGYAIPPARVLDNLLWFDWYIVRTTDFADSFDPVEYGSHHNVLELGCEFIRRFRVCEPDSPRSEV